MASCSACPALASCSAGPALVSFPADPVLASCSACRPSLGLLPCRPHPGTPVCLFLQALFHSTGLAHRPYHRSTSSPPPPRHFSVFSVCGASGIRFLKGRGGVLCHGPAVCVLSTWFVVGAMCSLVYCLPPPILLTNHCFSCTTCVSLVCLPI